MRADVNASLLRAVDEEIVSRQILASSKPHQIAKADRARHKLAKQYLSKIAVALDLAKQETMANLRSAMRARSIDLGNYIRAASVSSVMFDLGNFASNLLGGLEDVADTISRTFSINRQNKLKDVPQNIYDQIKGQIEDGMKSGATEDEIADSIEDAFDQVYEGRAQVVARTEAASGYGFQQAQDLADAGIEYKQWLSAEDDDVRPSHAAVDGEVVPVDEPFSNGLMYPGDPDGDPDEVINCRCTMIAAESPDED